MLGSSARPSGAASGGDDVEAPGVEILLAEAVQRVGERRLGASRQAEQDLEARPGRFAGAGKQLLQVDGVEGAGGEPVPVGLVRREFGGRRARRQRRIVGRFVTRRGRGGGRRFMPGRGRRRYGQSGLAQDGDAAALQRVFLPGAQDGLVVGEGGSRPGVSGRPGKFLGIQIRAVLFQETVGVMLLAAVEFSRRVVDQRDVAADADPVAGAVGGKTEIEVVEVEAVEAHGVETELSRHGGAGDHAQAVDRPDLAGDRPLQRAEDVEGDLPRLRRGVRDDAVQEGQVGARPQVADQPAGAGKAEEVEMRQAVHDLAGEIRVEDQDVVVGKDQDVAVRLLHAAVVAFGERPGVVDADDLAAMAGEQAPVSGADLGEFACVDAADDDGKARCRIHDARKACRMRSEKSATKDSALLAGEARRARRLATSSRAAPSCRARAQ